jgi:hypothetical protein
MLPRHAMSSIMVWNAGDGPWWAPTAEIKKFHLLSTSRRPLHQGAGQSKCGKSLCILLFWKYHSLPKGGPKSDLHPRPLDLCQNVPDNIANTPVDGTWEELLKLHCRNFQPISPCPPGHLPPQTECAGVLRYV